MSMVEHRYDRNCVCHFCVRETELREEHERKELEQRAEEERNRQQLENVEKLKAKQEKYEAHNKDLCPCEVCQRYRKQNPTATREKMKVAHETLKQMDQQKTVDEYKRVCQELELLTEHYNKTSKLYEGAKEELEQHSKTLIQVSRTFVKELDEKNKEIERLQEENKRLKEKKPSFSTQITINATHQGNIKQMVKESFEEFFEHLGKNFDKGV